MLKDDPAVRLDLWREFGNVTTEQSERYVKTITLSVPDHQGYAAWVGDPEQEELSQSGSESHSLGPPEGPSGQTTELTTSELLGGGK